MIYFVVTRDQLRIKIGTTIRLSERIKQLRSDHKEKLEVLAVMDGGFVEEKILHRKFAHCRDKGEWFFAEKEIYEFIAAHADQWNGEDEAPPSPLTTIRVDAETADAIRLAAAMKRVSIGEYLHEVVLPIALRTIKDEADKISGVAKPKPPKR